jgi:hypothetical protein
MPNEPVADTGLKIRWGENVRFIKTPRCKKKKPYLYRNRIKIYLRQIKPFYNKEIIFASYIIHHTPKDAVGQVNNMQVTAHAFHFHSRTVLARSTYYFH